MIDLKETINKLNEDAKKDYDSSLLFDESDVFEKRIKEKLQTKAEEKWQIARWLMELADIKEKLKPLESHIEQEIVSEIEKDWFLIAENIYLETEKAFPRILKEFHWEMSEDVFDALTGNFKSNKNENVTLYGLEIWEVKGKDHICLKLS